MDMKQNIPWKLVLAYALDWVFVLAIAAVGGGLSYATPYRRPFSVVDLSISYPFQEAEIISTGLLVVLSLVLPGLIVAGVVTLFFPPPSGWRDVKTWKFWERKIWEGNAAVLGLALSYAMSLCITQVFKHSVGKPRPDFLARCQPDLTDIQEYVRGGGGGASISPAWSIVDYRICQQPNAKTLNEGFKAYFSGHSSAAFAGLFYLSLWLAVKFNITFPYVQPYTAHELANTPADESETLPSYRSERAPKTTSLVDRHPIQLYRRAGAAPPVWGMAIILAPTLFAVWIASTRFQEFKHDGFDCISGSLCGVITALIGFRAYHNGILRGQSWTWGPRTWDNAFVVTSSARQRMSLHKRGASSRDIEMQPKDIRPSEDERPSTDLDHQNLEQARLHGQEAGPSQPYYSQYAGRTR
ncbi:Diacylglycerol pyrophosphate phosphatase 1 [Sphaceloma murrayae]|uniref:Diacylglycerol pyrophosphate phosphatase 1 n=1 Tax=Sphaceloma murrayae TaxID=2082308 RepID=A0A2K1R108_9PEZI|nr:Diacylglycerol pyrophosphate phosphatase 1 [Sphaceloma murrayae]